VRFFARAREEAIGGGGAHGGGWKSHGEKEGAASLRYDRMGKHRPGRRIRRIKPPDQTYLSRRS